MLMCVEDEQLKKFYQLAVLTGMRRGELLFLTWDHVDLENSVISVQSSKEYRVKQGKGRMIPISAEAAKILKTLRGNDPYVFMTEKGIPYPEDYVTKKFKQAVRDAGLREDFRLHCLRHTFATLLGKAGVPALHTKELMGHTYVKTTEAYTRIPSGDLRHAIEQITLPPI
jgi:integrase